jgi:NAD(P)-dependent dehydrogenase (short-subunit alcohol dehydrogenase family)
MFYVLIFRLHLAPIAGVSCFNQALNSHYRNSNITKGILLSAAKNHGCIATSCPVDVTKAEEVFKTFELLSKSVRYPLCGLATFAGISGEAPAIEYQETTARKIFDINYFGSLFCAQAAARCFQANNVPGSIVLIASMSGSIANKVSRLITYVRHPSHSTNSWVGFANSGIQLFESGSVATGPQSRRRMGKLKRFTSN